jgi:acyl-CoA hydrolase
MDLKRFRQAQVVNATEAISKIKNGSRVFIGTGCGEPQHLIKAMVDDSNIQDILVYQMLSSTLSRFIDDESFHRRFSLKLFFISQSMRKAAFEGKIDYIPAYLSQIPRLFASQRIGLDVALVQVSPPDKFGYCSLGVSVDITRSGLENAHMVIAQVNPRMPRTWGDSFVHIDEIDWLVPFEEPLVEEVPTVKDNEIARRIGLFVSQLIDDGATLQIGFGHLPYAILPYLENKKDLGLHTQLITDGLLPLFEKNVITNKKKTLLPGRTVASLCMGSEKLYTYVDNNPAFYFRSSEFVNDPTVLDQFGFGSGFNRSDLFGLHGLFVLQRYRGSSRFFKRKFNVEGRIFDCGLTIDSPKWGGLTDCAAFKRGRRCGYDPRGCEFCHY